MLQPVTLVEIRCVVIFSLQSFLINLNALNDDNLKLFFFCDSIAYLATCSLSQQVPTLKFIKCCKCYTYTVINLAFRHSCDENAPFMMELIELVFACPRFLGQQSLSSKDCLKFYCFLAFCLTCILFDNDGI